MSLTLWCGDIVAVVVVVVDWMGAIALDVVPVWAVAVVVTLAWSVAVIVTPGSPDISDIVTLGSHCCRQLR